MENSFQRKTFNLWEIVYPFNGFLKNDYVLYFILSLVQIYYIIQLLWMYLYLQSIKGGRKHWKGRLAEGIYSLLEKETFFVYFFEGFILFFLWTYSIISQSYWYTFTFFYPLFLLRILFTTHSSNASLDGNLCNICSFLYPVFKACLLSCK